MTRALALLIVMLAGCPGCAMLEDLVYGPDPNEPAYLVAEQTVTPSCNAPPPTSTTSQSPEPELLKR